MLCNPAVVLKDSFKLLTVSRDGYPLQAYSKGTDCDICACQEQQLCPKLVDAADIAMIVGKLLIGFRLRAFSQGAVCMWVLTKIRENDYFVTRSEGVELVYCVNKLEWYSNDAVTCIAIREDGYEILCSSCYLQLAYWYGQL